MLNLRLNGGVNLQVQRLLQRNAMHLSMSLRLAITVCRFLRMSVAVNIVPKSSKYMRWKVLSAELTCTCVAVSRAGSKKNSEPPPTISMYTSMARFVPGETHWPNTPCIYRSSILFGWVVPSHP